MDLLLTTGCEPIMTVSTMFHPLKLEDLTFVEIIQIIQKIMRPKKISLFSKRTQFVATR